MFDYQRAFTVRDSGSGLDACSRGLWWPKFTAAGVVLT
jgi:hypothetical protein